MVPPNLLNNANVADQGNNIIDDDLSEQHNVDDDDDLESLADYPLDHQ